jgi:hypothetical protein
VECDNRFDTEIREECDNRFDTEIREECDNHLRFFTATGKVWIVG